MIFFFSFKSLLCYSGIIQTLFQILALHFISYLNLDMLFNISELQNSLVQMTLGVLSVKYKVLSTVHDKCLISGSYYAYYLAGSQGLLF